MPQVRAEFNYQPSVDAQRYEIFYGTQRLGFSDTLQFTADLELEYGTHNFSVRGVNVDGTGPFRSTQVVLEEPYVPLPTPGPIGALEVSLVILGGSVGGGEPPVEPPSGTLYDLSAFSIPAQIINNFTWPTAPSASTVINIPENDSAALNAALSQSDVRIIVPAGTYDWSADITGSDLWLDMANGATLDADAYGWRNILGTRTKITGGNMSLNQAFNSGAFVISGHSGDLHIENVNMNVNGFFPASNSGGPSRVAILNNTIQTRDSIIYADTVSALGAFSNVDQIWAGNNLTKTLSGQAHMRMYDQNRLIVVDNRFSSPGNSAFRALGGSLDVYFGNNQIEADGEKPYISVNHFNTTDINGDLKYPDQIFFMDNTWYSAFTGTNVFASFADEVTITGNRAYQPDGFNISANNETPPNPANYSDNLTVGPYQTPPVWTKGADH